MVQTRRSIQAQGAQEQKEETIRDVYNLILTLEPDKQIFDRLLQTANIETLKRPKKNAINYVQADVLNGQIRKRPEATEEDGAPAKISVELSSLTTDTEALTLANGQVSHSHSYPPCVNINKPAWKSACQVPATNMDPPPPRPKLNLKLSLSNVHNSSNDSPQTPSSQQPVRTPSITLKLGKPGSAISPVSQTGSKDGQVANSSGKKRKRPGTPSVNPEPVSASKPPRLLKLITKQTPSTAKNSAITPGIKLKTKGKIPKRPQGVGYDSELEDREVDPVILEAFVLRMLPGEDCDYIRDAITNGTIGVSILQKGADIRLRFLDVNGRRGILIVRGNQYAITLVDLPTITEGMKSWDRKNFIKSVDVSQMCLVLGPCSSDDEARNYPLPPDVNPKNYQYAHGLTAPMRNVRKRRFERTARARVDDIEAIERKVSSLLEADARADEVKYEVLDYDPRTAGREYSPEFDSDEDAEGEEDDEDGYFPHQNGATDSALTGTPQYNQAEAEELAALFNEDDEDSTAPAPATTGTSTAAPSSNLATSTAVSPAAGPSDAEAQADSDADDDDDDGPDVDADADADDDDESDRDNNDEKAEILAKIKDIQEKIAEQEAKFKKTDNRILKSKISKKVAELQSDLRMQRRHAGLAGEEEGDGDGGDGAASEED
ncbi:hypothetical protein H2198_009911 [Neophaeococcomyces mojaviensis]|uniref:Uncharacterized protein n=1 Tax=Neophaeococcomyces mojaviensis TaxID=3383035 RepID=A0ACC2ZT41_9EURO|nr:hypothetical protein H2198_009911 [Knufia sp. JES_112]